jgi:hypothetical protein
VIWLLSIIGGLLNRARGSHVIPLPHGVKRVIFALATGGLAYGLGIEWHWAAGVAAAFYGGLLPKWGVWMDLGRVQGAWAADMALLSLRGLILTLPGGLMLTYAEGWPFLLYALSGGMMGVCYELGWRIPSKLPNFEAGPPLGEIIFGTAVWAGMIGGSVL